MAVTEALNGRGIAVTKGAGGLPVTFVLAGNEWPSGGGGGGGGFTPASLTGLIGWWDASIVASLSLTGADINSVADQSGGGRTMSWTGFVKPTYSATGFNSTKPAILVANGSALISALGFPMGTGNTLTAWHVGTMCNSSGSDPDARAMTYFALGASTDFDNVGSWAVYRNGSTTQVASFIRNLNIASTAATVTAYPARASVYLYDQLEWGDDALYRRCFPSHGDRSPETGSPAAYCISATMPSRAAAAAGSGQARSPKPGSPPASPTRPWWRSSTPTSRTNGG